MKHTDDTTERTPSPLSGAVALRTVLLLALTLISLGVVAFLIFAAGRAETEVVEAIVPSHEAVELGVNQSEVIDAIGRRDVTAELGRRYEVIIDDESDEGAAGIAHIGGLVVFVSNTRRGERVVIEITRMKRSTAEAIVVSRIAAAIPTAPGNAGTPRTFAKKPPPIVNDGPLLSTSEAPVVGGKYRGTIIDIGKKGDGITKVGGKVVFIPGTAKGEEVEFVITEDRESSCQALLISKTGETPAAEPRKASAADGAVPGAEFDVVIKDKDRKTPDRDGVARIDGLVVFVPNSQPGDRVKIRITDRQPRFATAEVIERLTPEAGTTDHGANPVR